MPRNPLPAALVCAATLLAAGLSASVSYAAPAAPHLAPPQKVDFDGDGYNDQAVSGAEATIGGKKKAGYVAVISGSAHGLDTTRHTVIDQDTAGIPGTVEAGDTFGGKPLTGDLNGDGYTDLVVSAPAEDVGTTKDAGTATIIWGSATGLSGGTAIERASTETDRFDLDSVGDFNGDGHLDLVDVDSAVFLGPFSAKGAAKTVPLDAHQDGYGFPARGIPGDLNGDGIDDLVIVTDIEHEVYDVTWWRGTKDGLALVGPVKDSEGKSPFMENPAAGVVADVDGDGLGDLVMESPDEITGGSVIVYKGSEDGPGATAPYAVIDQSTPGVSGTGEDWDRFGSSLAAGDINGDGYADITVGSPGEDDNAGRVVLLHGSAKGLTGEGAQSISQSTAGIPGASENYDYFGQSVSMTDLNADGRPDLTVGGPGENTYHGAGWSLLGTANGYDTTANVVNFVPSTLGAPATEAHLGDYLGH